MLFRRTRSLRPLAVGYFLVVAAAIEFTGARGIHPTLGRVWDFIATAGALCVAAVPFVSPSRPRGILTGIGAFVILTHATEWLRLTDFSPVGLSVAALWTAALLGVILQVGADQEVSIKDKLPPPTPEI